MEIRTKKVETEQKIYVAKDGQEFKTEQDCFWHEKELRDQELAPIVEALPKFDIDPRLDSDPSVGWTCYFVRSEEEIAAIRDHIYAADSTADTAWTERPQFPCWVVATVDSDGYGIMYTWKDLMQELTGIINSVTLKMAEIMANIISQNQEVNP